MKWSIAGPVPQLAFDQTRWATLCAATLFAFVASAASAATVVVPNAQATVKGDGNNAFPFSCFGSGSMRYQQVYLASEVGSGAISQLAFRQTPGATAFGPTTIPGVTITLSSTSNGPDTLSTTFASNVGADVTTVFSGNLTLSSAANAIVPPNAAPFDIVIPLQTAFTFNAALGKNLLLDVTVPTCVKLGTFDVGFDSQNTNADSVSRVLNVPSAATTGLPDSLGLITQFTIGAAPPPPPLTPVPTLSAWSLLVLAGLLSVLSVGAFRRKR